MASAAVAAHTCSPIRRRARGYRLRISTDRLTPADRDPTLKFDKNGHKHFSSNGMDQQDADDKHYRAGYTMNRERSRLRPA
jgi:hypothetical protein